MSAQPAGRGRPDPNSAGQWLVAVTLIAFTATLVTGYAVTGVSARLRDDTGKSLVTLEFAGWCYSSDKVMRAWNERGLVPTAIRAQKIDFLFAASYGAFALAAAVLVWQARRGPRDGRVLALLVALGAAAALVDEIENAKMWAILHGHATADRFLPSTAAGLKFALLLASTVGILLALFWKPAPPGQDPRT
jgi:hypothetical protein